MAQVEDGLLSEDGLDVENSDEEDQDAVEIAKVLQEENIQDNVEDEVEEDDAIDDQESSRTAEALPLSQATRFDKTKKEKISITCPFVVQEYNKHMGGVDLMDSFLGRNHITLRSKKWYLRIFFHLFDLAVINSWIIYKKKCWGKKFASKGYTNFESI